MLQVAGSWFSYFGKENCKAQHTIEETMYIRLYTAINVNIFPYGSMTVLVVIVKMRSKYGGTNS